MTDFFNLLKKLSEASGIPGYEHRIIEIFRDELKDYVDTIETDTLGNIIAVKRGTNEKSPKIMVEAHIDEPGLMVKYIEDNGFIRMDYGGLPLLQSLPFNRVKIHGRFGEILGVIGAPGLHTYFMEMGGEKGPSKPLQLRDLFIDVGAKSRREVEDMGIRIGASITFHSKLEKIGQNLVVGKAFDNRAACAVLIETIKRLKTIAHKSTIYAVGAVQEEPGQRGGMAAAFKIDPYMAIVFDIAIPGDTPGVEFRDFPIKVGDGPCILIKDMIWDFLVGHVAHPKIVDLMVKTAVEGGIPYQLETMSGKCTDAATITTTGKGIPCGTISLPARYSHTASEVISLDDLENAIKLLIGVLTKVDENFDLHLI